MMKFQNLTAILVACNAGCVAATCAIAAWTFTMLREAQELTAIQTLHIEAMRRSLEEVTTPCSRRQPILGPISTTPQTLNDTTGASHGIRNL